MVGGVCWGKGVWGGVTEPAACAYHHQIACMLQVFRLQFHRAQPHPLRFVLIMHVSQPDGLTWDTRSRSHPEAIAFFLSLCLVPWKTLHLLTTGRKPDFRVIKTIHSLSCGNTSCVGFPWLTDTPDTVPVLVQGASAECHHLPFQAPGLATCMPLFPRKLIVWIMLLQLAWVFLLNYFFLLLWHQLLDIISNVVEKASFMKGWFKTKRITFDS